MRSIRSLAVVFVACAACGGPAGPSTPAANGVDAYLSALKRNDPRDAYELLSASVRKKISYDEFALQWRQSAKERAWQIAALEHSRKMNPDAGERARISFPDGKTVALERDIKEWRLESELVSRSRAKKPRDAIRLFAEALASRDVNALMRSLSQRRREGIAKQVEGFMSGLDKRLNDKLYTFGNDRAELQWDENGIRYRIVLRREDEEWRVDDIYIRPAPRDDEPKEEAEGPIDF